MPAQMTLSMWGQGAKNALICGLAFLALWCVMAVAVSVLSGQAISESFDDALAVCWALTFLLFLADWLYGRANAGRLLLDCGPQPMWSLFLINAGLFLILAWMERGVTASVSLGFIAHGPVFDLSLAGFFLVIATGRLQLRPRSAA